MTSLLAGRNVHPLDDREIRRVTNIFLGLDDSVAVLHDAAGRTRFRVTDEAPEGEIVFGPDIYPGPGMVDANSGLSVDGAAAHELAHYYRWRNRTALPDDAPEELDEAMTSLDAIVRYARARQLSANDILGLVADALQRLRMYVDRLDAERHPVAGPADPPE